MVKFIYNPIYVFFTSYTIICSYQRTSISSAACESISIQFYLKIQLQPVYFPKPPILSAVPKSTFNKFNTFSLNFDVNHFLIITFRLYVLFSYSLFSLSSISKPHLHCRNSSFKLFKNIHLIISISIRKSFIIPQITD